MLKRVGTLAFTTMVRVGANLLTFLMAARLIGPGEFGQLMLANSISLILAGIFSWGINPYLLSTLPKISLARQERLIAQLFSGKIIVGVPVVIMLWLGGQLSGYSGANLFIVVLIAITIETFLDFFSTIFRATNRVGADTVFLTVAALIQLGSIAIVYPWVKSAQQIAVTILVARFVALGIVIAFGVSEKMGLCCLNVRKIIRRLTSINAFALDTFLQNLFGQVDSIIISLTVGHTAVGIYQSAMRFYFGFSNAIGVLSNAFIPKLAEHQLYTKAWLNNYLVMRRFFLATGGAVCVVLVFGGYEIIAVVLGHKYSEAGALMPWIGVLFLLRCFASCNGAALTVANQQRYRTKINLLNWFGIISFGAILTRNFGLVGWLLSLNIGTVFLIFFYQMKLIQMESRKTRNLGERT